MMRTDQRSQPRDRRSRLSRYPVQSGRQGCGVERTALRSGSNSRRQRKTVHVIIMARPYRHCKSEPALCSGRTTRSLLGSARTWHTKTGGLDGWGKVFVPGWVAEPKPLTHSAALAETFPAARSPLTRPS